MKPILVLTCLCFTGAPNVNGVSKKVMDFVSYWNGVCDNKLQTQQPGDDHAFIQVRIVPVDIECFRPDPVLFAEEDVNGVIRNFLLLVVTEGIEDTVSLAFYNFADESTYKPREFNVTSFSSMSCGAFHRVENCTASYKVANGYVFGNFPQCGYTVQGKHPRFSCMHTCNSVTITTPQNADQPSPIEPYELLYTETKFPVINPPEGYVAPCGPKIENITDKTNLEPSAS